MLTQLVLRVLRSWVRMFRLCLGVVSLCSGFLALRSGKSGRSSHPETERNERKEKRRIYMGIIYETYYERRQALNG